MNNYKYVKYPTEKFFVAEGMYTLEELEQLFVNCINLHRDHIKTLYQSMQEIKEV